MGRPVRVRMRVELRQLPGPMQLLGSQVFRSLLSPKPALHAHGIAGSMREARVRASAVAGAVHAHGPRKVHVR